MNIYICVYLEHLFSQSGKNYSYNKYKYKLAVNRSTKKPQV